MRALFISFVLGLGALTAGAARARATTDRHESLLSSDQAPAPGTCAYLQPGVKVCSALADGQGAFDVYTSLPAVLYVRTEDPIVRFVPPDPRYFQADLRENTVVLL